MSRFRFSVGPWNVHPGADSYGPETRKDIPIEEKFKKFAELGFSAVQFHDDDAVPNINQYTEEEIREMMNHINSYPRKKWNGQAPIDLFIKIYGQETANLLGLEKIPSDSITLTPALFKK